jgi:RNA polymerase sigma-70 factor (ECF subfamily)
MLDEQTFHTLYANAATPLRAYISRTLGDASAADDIVQETFLRLLRRPFATTSIEDLRKYAFRVASNLIVDHWRSHKRDAPSGNSDDGAIEHRPPVPAEALYLEPSLRLDVARQFARLTLRDRRLLWLAHVEGAQHREIARMLGVRAGSVRVLLSRARKRLARLLRSAEQQGRRPR